MSILKTLAAIAAALALVFVALDQRVDWQVLMVKYGVKLLDAPDVDSGPVVVAHSGGNGGGDYQLRVIADGFELPWTITRLGDDQALVTERVGRLQLLSLADGQYQEVSGLPEVHYAGQGGLFDVALHPAYAQNGLVYISYAVAVGDGKSTTRLARAVLNLDQMQLDRFEVLYTAQPALKSGRHFGGRLLFHDQHLYMTVGERGNPDTAQLRDNDLGAVLRLNDDGSAAAGNPFANSNPALFSYGHRNPQGLVRRPGTDELWVAEHGPQGGDEINLLIAGANYGWPVITYGEHYGGGKIGEGTHKEGMEQPYHYYVPSIGVGNLAFSAGNPADVASSSLFVTGLRSLDLSHLTVTTGDGQTRLGNDQRLLKDQQMRLRDVKLWPSGDIYLLSENGSVAVLSASTGS